MAGERNADGNSGRFAMTTKKVGHDDSPDAFTGSPQASSGQDRRKRAEEIVREKAARMPKNLEALSLEEARRLLHEVQVYEIELEMQNEELHRAERRQYLSLEILRMLNQQSPAPDAIGDILTVIKVETGFDAVGIRLRSGDDFPYFV
jgi:hypothetical protein